MKDINDFMHEVYQFYMGHMYMTRFTYISDDSYSNNFKICLEFRDTTFNTVFIYFIPYTVKNKNTVNKKALKYLRSIDHHLDNMERGI